MLRPATAAAAAASSKNRERETALSRELGLPNLQQSSNTPVSTIPTQKFRAMAVSATTTGSNLPSGNSSSAASMMAPSVASNRMNESVYRSLSLVTPSDTRGITPTAQNYRLYNPSGLSMSTVSDGFVTQFSTNPALIDLKQNVLQGKSNKSSSETSTKNLRGGGGVTTTNNNNTKSNNTNLIAGALPLLLSENSHCYVCGSLQDVAMAVQEILEAHDVDVQFKPEKCKWSGSIYDRNRKLSLRVFLYRMQQDSSNNNNERFVLEFQRRRGCPLLFANLYQDVCKDLAERKILCSRDGTIISSKQVETAFSGVRRSFEPLELPEGFADFKVTVDAFKPLIDMAQSDYVDVQQEAMREIANQASNAKTRQVLGESQEIIPVLVNGLTSPDSEVRHCACSALESFSRDKVFQEKIADRGGVQKFCQLLAQSRIENMDRETRRVLCKATANLASSFKDILRDDIKVFQELASNPDHKIKDAAQQVLKAITA